MYKMLQNFQKPAFFNEHVLMSSYFWKQGPQNTEFLKDLYKDLNCFAIYE